MPRIARYSSSRVDRRALQEATPSAHSDAEQLAEPAAGTPNASSTPPAAKPTPTRHRTAWLLAAALLAFNAGFLGYWTYGSPEHAKAQQITQKDIDAAVLRTLQTKPLPSATARAAAIVAPSVVHVTGYVRTKRGTEVERGEGTGVVIVDKGTILTNLHVVRGTRRIEVTFADGTVSDAVVTNVQAENDLAVLQAKLVPDDLKAATLRSTDGLNPGDGVVIIGFPFGIGPSVSAGVVSGLDREFESPEGKQVLRNLIQFDAAANPGNSGGPLITLDGEVVGIVTAILNPSSARTFAGIGFAVPIENAASAIGSSPF